MALDHGPFRGHAEASDRGSRTGSTLAVLKFSIPDALLQKTKTLTLSASVQNTPVGKQTYKSAGRIHLQGRCSGESAEG